MHTRDTRRLIKILDELRDLGNTILVVEHDPEVMRAADHILDMGPGAGENGGHVVFEGSYPELLQDGAGSLTARYLRGEAEVHAERQRRKTDPKQVLKFFGARTHNLKNIDVEIPLGMMVVVSGVSGSGKSTLVHEVIYRSLQALIKRGGEPAESSEEANPGDRGPRVTCARVEGAGLLDEMIMIDQSPLGRTPRSNPVTYIQAFDLIRMLFADTPEARKRGYGAGHFSFTVAGGRCEVCAKGDGTVKVEMQFLADVEADLRGVQGDPVQERHSGGSLSGREQSGASRRHLRSAEAGRWRKRWSFSRNRSGWCASYRCWTMWGWGICGWGNRRRRCRAARRSG